MRPEIRDIPLHLDDRGSVYCVFDNLDESAIKRTYVVKNWHAGTIRAWHGHKMADTYIHVIKGAAKVCAMSMDKLDDFIVSTLSGAKPQLFYIPAGWYNGTMTLQDDTRILVYSTLSFDEVKNDDVRKELIDIEVDLIWKVAHR